MPARKSTSADTTTRSIQAGLAAWVIPGAGHFVLGHRGLAIVFFVAITFPYTVGLALGGVANFANPRVNKWLFLAELPVGGYTVPAYMASRSVERDLQRRAQRGEEIDVRDYYAYFPASDVAQIYLATAGLLNILAILDAIARAQTGGLPTFHRQLQPSAQEGADG